MSTQTMPRSKKTNHDATKGSVFGVFKSKRAAEGCFDALIAAGHAPSEINVMMSDKTRARDFSAEAAKGAKAGSHAADGVGVGGAVGTVVGASLAAIAAVGTSLALPGLGIIIAGPIAAALAGAGAGAVTGGAIGGLIGLGITEQNAQRYNEALANGGVVLSVKTGESEDAAEVQRVMVAHGGEEVAVC